MAIRYDQSSIKALIEHFFPNKLSSDQNTALEKISEFIIRFREPLGFVLNGYAGSGKTSIVGALTKALPCLNITPVLLSPTGRAAKVLSLYSKHSAYTIHKYIYYNALDSSGNIKSTLKKNKAKNSLFIIDEASMISYGDEASVLDDLIKFVYEGYNCRLLFLGDPAQLPPVGQDYSPALNCEFLQRRYDIEFLSHTLCQVLRQKKQSLVLENATKIRSKLVSGDYDLPLFCLKPNVLAAASPDVSVAANSSRPNAGSDQAAANFSKQSNRCFSSENFEFLEDLENLKSENFEEIMQNAFSSTSREDSVLITRSNKRANIFNQAIRQRFLQLENEISAGELLMIVKNNYFWTTDNENIDFLANGDIVEVKKIIRIEEIYGFRFADIEVSLIDYKDCEPMEIKIFLDSLHVEAAALSYQDSRALWEEVEKDYIHIKSRRLRFQKIKNNPYINAVQVKYAYSLTCHKTQGGQWKNVFIDIGYFTEDMLSVEFLRWMYTALTRTTSKCYLIGFDEEFFE